jgi:predicted RNA polymerase sigma factor
LRERSKSGDETIAGFGTIAAVTKAVEKWLRARWPREPAVPAWLSSLSHYSGPMRLTHRSGVTRFMHPHLFRDA